MLALSQMLILTNAFTTCNFWFGAVVPIPTLPAKIHLPVRIDLERCHFVDILHHLRAWACVVIQCYRTIFRLRLPATPANNAVTTQPANNNFFPICPSCFDKVIRIFLELKSVRRVVKAHEVQLVNYLVA